MQSLGYVIIIALILLSPIHCEASLKSPPHLQAVKVSVHENLGPSIARRALLFGPAVLIQPKHQGHSLEVFAADHWVS